MGLRLHSGVKYLFSYLSRKLLALSSSLAEENLSINFSL